MLAVAVVVGQRTGHIVVEEVVNQRRQDIAGAGTAVVEVASPST